MYRSSFLQESEPVRPTPSSPLGLISYSKEERLRIKSSSLRMSQEDQKNSSILPHRRLQIGNINIAEKSISMEVIFQSVR